MTVSRLSNTTLWHSGELLLEYVTSFGPEGIIYSLLVCVALIVCNTLNQTTNIVKEIGDVGYGYLTDELPRRRKNQRIKEVNDARDVGEIPPVYPNGWFVIAESRELVQGQTLAVTTLGHEFAVFRGEDGKAYIVDAYCPHLGAHLAVGGKVSGSCIECPFHGWKFRGQDGQCIHVPYTEKVPEFVKIKTWPAVELNGCVFVWHHAEGEPPQWQVPEVPEISTGQWQYRGRSQHGVRCHIQEVPENGPDVAHLNHIHKAAVMTGGDLRYNDSKLWQGMQHAWTPTWEAEPEPNSHMTKMTIKHATMFFGIHFPYFDVNLSVKQIGPAFVLLWFDTAFGKGVYVQYTQPQGPLQHKLVHMVYTERNFLMMFGKLLLHGESIMLERDIMVWNSKKFMKNPVLVKEDRFIAKFRRWYSQFYSENSPTLKSIREKSLEW